MLLPRSNFLWLNFQFNLKIQDSRSQFKTIFLDEQDNGYNGNYTEINDQMD